MDFVMQHRWLLSRHPVMVGRARGLVAAAGAGWGRDVLDTATLLTSELMTDAVRDGETPSIDLWLSLTESELLVQVNYDVRTLPHTLTPSVAVEQSRGLTLVRSLASRWGTVATPGESTHAWFCLTGLLPQPQPQAA